MQKHLRLRVTGKVQGVGFRYNARREAEALGITGYAVNEPDGSVSVEAEGEAEKLRQFVEWCHRGPRAADVGAVEVSEKPLEGYTEFRTA